MGDHTLLDVTEHLADMGITEINQENRVQMLRFLNRQIDGLDIAWDEVVQGYANFVSEVIPKTPLAKKYSYKHERD